jgi:RNA polymerase sigma-70 factor (ECF subfamily)
VRSVSGIPNSRAWAAVLSDVGIPVIFRPSRTRRPSAATASAAVVPDPSPTIIELVTRAAADSAAWVFKESIFRLSLSISIWRINCNANAMRDTPESELITMSREGDRDAITELFHRHYPSSLRVAYFILRQKDDAEDAVQTAYFLAFRRLGKFRGESSFKTWMTRIVVNSCLLHAREARRRLGWQRLEEGKGIEAVSHAPNPEKSAWCGEVAAAFSRAVERLPKHLRDPYSLFAVAGLPLEEVATALDLTISATKTRLFRARAGMRRSLQGVWRGRGVKWACEGTLSGPAVLMSATLEADAAQQTVESRILAQWIVTRLDFEPDHPGFAVFACLVKRIEGRIAFAQRCIHNGEPIGRYVPSARNACEAFH